MWRLARHGEQANVPEGTNLRKPSFLLLGFGYTGGGNARS